MAKTVQLEKMLKRLIERYTRAVQDTATGGEAAALPVEQHVNGFLQELNSELERRVAARTADLQQIEAKLQTRARQQAVVAELGQFALAGAELAGLMNEACSRVTETLEVPYCTVLELLPDGQTLHVRAGVGWQDGRIGQATVGAGADSPAGYTLRSSKPVIVEDLRTETRFTDFPLLHEHGVISGMSVIIPGKPRPFGVCGVYTSTSRHFSPDDIYFLQCIANVLAEAVERKRAGAWLHSLIQTALDAVVAIDRQGCIVLFNPAAERMFGYTQAEVIGQTVNILMAEPYAREHDRYIEHYEQTGEARAIGRTRSVMAKRKSGQLFPIELSVTEVQTESQVRYSAFIRNISEKVQLQERLLEQERLAAIGTTAATFAHEVGNPLNGMSLTAQILERRLAKRPAQVEDDILTPLRTLMGEIRRLSLLLDEFRTLARRQTLHYQPLQLAHLVTDVLTTEAPEFEAADVQVTHQLPSDLPVISADRERLKQVLLNLCKNAVEAMPQGGTLSVSVTHVDSSLQLDISDTGVGIPDGVDIFEPFVTTKAQGTGLGLTITRQILAAHHGSLTCQSTPGQGTRFTLTLPIAQPETRD